ncbi:MAG: cyclodeaminase/cyclohydrolase family protein [Synergistaceae bacterium]|jgi:formiminotetrahydrofolate cyclodeaminase|nr:cyclodeaminase/cyclohydrolase family protein [Synergistaceae bacterium]
MTLTDMTVKVFTETLASESPAPGGGSSSALSGALGAALVAMVCRLTAGRPKYAEHQALAKDMLPKADELTRKLLDAVQRDTDAFEEVMAAFGMPKETESQKAQRGAAIQSAYKAAVASPTAMADYCLSVMRLAESLMGKSNSNAASDLAVGALQAHAGFKGAVANIRINLPFLKDADYTAEKKAWLVRSEKEAGELIRSVESGMARLLAP